MPRPRPEDYPTLGQYWWARRLWIRRHGGSLIGTLPIAVFFGALTGSPVLLFSLIAFALVGTAYARSQ
jgi:hypothetical protein